MSVKSLVLAGVSAVAVVMGAVDTAYADQTGIAGQDGQPASNNGGLGGAAATLQDGTTTSENYTGGVGGNGAVSNQGSGGNGGIGGAGIFVEQVGGTLDLTIGADTVVTGGAGGVGAGGTPNGAGGAGGVGILIDGSGLNNLIIQAGQGGVHGGAGGASGAFQGTPDGSGGNGGIGIRVSQSLGSILNYANIAGGDAYSQSINQVPDLGGSGGDAIRIDENVTINGLVNLNGTISGGMAQTDAGLPGMSGWGVNNHGSISMLSNGNYMDLSVGGTITGVLNFNQIGTLINIGAISGGSVPQISAGISNFGNITTVLNVGSITVADGGVADIWNRGSIGVLVNLQNNLTYAFDDGMGGNTLGTLGSYVVGVIGNAYGKMTVIRASSNSATGVDLNVMSLYASGSLTTGMTYDDVLTMNNGGVAPDSHGKLIVQGVTIGTSESDAVTYTVDGKNFKLWTPDGGYTYDLKYIGDGGDVPSISRDEIQTSFDAVQQSRNNIAVHQGGYAGILLGDLERQQAGYELGAFGLYGSAVGGLKGRAGWADNVSLSGGILGGSGDYDALSYKGLMGALALRYDFAQTRGWRPFVQVGASFGQLGDLTFKRSYSYGGSTYSADGSTSGQIAAAFARLGVTGDVSSTDQIQLEIEGGERALFTGAYAEDVSALNPYSATFGAGHDLTTVGKVALAWTHNVTADLDVTLRGALGTTLAGSSGLKGDVAGFGQVKADYQRATWGEAGVRLGYRVTDRLTVDAYALGEMGQNVSKVGHVGGGLRVAF